MKSHLHISAIVLALSVAGCGGWSADKARRALDLSARGVNLADASVASGYRALNDKLEARIDEGDITLEQFDEERAPWQQAVRVVQSSRMTLRATEHAVDAWEQLGDGSEFIEVVPCMFLALKELHDALESIDVPMPEVLEAIEFVADRVEGGCEMVLEAP